jgi:ATP-binding cassette subfamily B protein
MAASSRSDFGILLRTLSERRRRQLLIVALLMPLTALAEMAMVAAIVPFLALLSGGSETRLPLLQRMMGVTAAWVPNDPIMATALLFTVAVIATMVCRLALSWTSQQFAFGTGHELAVEIQRRLLRQPYLFHLQRHSSELLAVLDKVEVLIFNASLQGLQAISAAIISLFVIAALLWIDPLSALIALALVGGLYGLALTATRARLASHGEVIRSSFEARLKALQDSLGGIRDIILDRSQEARVSHFRRIDARLMRSRAEAQFLVAAPRFLVEGLGLISIAALTAAIATRPGGFVAALPIIGALALGAQRLLPLTSQIYAGWAGFTASVPTIRELAELLDLPADEETAAQIAPLPLNEAIELKNVAFRYADRDHAALDDINLIIPRGARIAVTGKTGSGKSTLADLIMGLIEPSLGEVKVDGTVLTGPMLARWRRSIAHVPQAIFLSGDSIAANIALSVPGDDIDMERVNRAAEKAQLADFIASLPDGLETRIGERGSRLSGGQRQRLALARAIYKEAPLLLLDEATNALDDETEKAVLRVLDSLQAEGRTIIVIAHRGTAISGCDFILKLEKGRVASEQALRPQASSAVADR